VFSIESSCFSISLAGVSFRRQRIPKGFAVVNCGREFFQTNQVSEATFQAALQQFGTQGLAELTTLMGYYALLAFNANAFAIDLPAERTETVLPV
jgi:hypothetical protein